jgi:hypothetical protein
MDFEASKTKQTRGVHVDGMNNTANTGGPEIQVDTVMAVGEAVKERGVYRLDYNTPRNRGDVKSNWRAAPFPSVGLGTPGRGERQSGPPVKEEAYLDPVEGDPWELTILSAVSDSHGVAAVPEIHVRVVIMGL